jgi:hypothetical protein
MYYVQIILTHIKQTHCQPPFPTNMELFFNSSTNKDWKKNCLPSLIKKTRICTTPPHLQKTKGWGGGGV